MRGHFVTPWYASRLRMRIALITVYSHKRCTLKDVAGGYGTVFAVGNSWPARMLERAKSHLARLPSPTLGYLAALADDRGHSVWAHDVLRGEAGHTVLPEADIAIVLTSIVDASAERGVMDEYSAKGTHCVAVGAFASARPHFFAQSASAVIVGEAENIPDTVFSKETCGIIQADMVSNLDTLPIPNWTPFAFENFRYAMLSHGGTTLPIQGSRGCSFGCGYCPFRATSTYRERSVDSVVAEIRTQRQKYRANAFAFRDPLFNLNRDRVLALAEGIAPLGINFSAEMRADRLDDALLQALKRAGLRSLELGIESVDREMLKREKRSPAAEGKVEEVIQSAHRLGIRVIGNFMMGLPDDRPENVRKTVQWAKRLNTFAVQFTVATPYPGTTLEPRARLKRADTAPDDYTGWSPLFEHAHFSEGQLEELREWAYLSYHFRPRYFARFARSALASLF